MYFRKKTSGVRAYLQIVESHREGACVRQQVIATLGRLDVLQRSGQLERLLRSGARFAEKPLVANAFSEGEAIPSAARRIGPALVFERMWEESGCRAVVENIAGSSNDGFPLERAVFLVVLARLFSEGADDRDRGVEGVDRFGQRDLYGTITWLGDRLGPDEEGATPRARRRVKDVIEDYLFARRHKPLGAVSLVFTDATLSFEDFGGHPLGRGFPKDRQPEPPKRILAVLLDGKGWPICSEIWPGAIVDVGSANALIDRLRKRFSIGQVCVVADHSMIGVETIAELDARKLRYIVGVRLCADERALEIVLDDPQPFIPSFLTQWNEGSDYETKSVTLDAQRYIVCLNGERARQAATSRAADLADLEQHLLKGDEAAAATMGSRRFVIRAEDGSLAIDRNKVASEAKFDGMVVLRTNVDLPPPQGMLVYERARSVYWAFCAATPFDTRPVFRNVDQTIRGHAVCSFLAMVLKMELEERIAAIATAEGETVPSTSWPDILAGLDSLTEIEVEQAGRRFLLRSAPRPAASLALRAAGVALPPVVRSLGEA